MGGGSCHGAGREFPIATMIIVKRNPCPRGDDEDTEAAGQGEKRQKEIVRDGRLWWIIEGGSPPAPFRLAGFR